MFNSFGPQHRWLVAMTATYALGHVGSCFLVVYLVRIELVFLIPVVFTLIPAIGVSIGFRGKLFSKACEFPRATILVTLAYLATWLYLIWLYIKNVFPSGLW